MPGSQGSETSSTCTNPTNKTLVDVFDNDRIRYRRKGYGLILAGVLFIAFFVILPLAGEELYRSIIETGISTNLLYLLSSIIVHQGVFIIANMWLNLIYWLELPFFERYKTNNYPWPWKANPEEWKIQRNKTWRTVFVNTMLLGPGLVLIDCALGLVDFDFSPQTFPTVLEVIF
jgi:hypothetical protein